MKKKIFTVPLLLCYLMLPLCGVSDTIKEPNKDFGVFIGAGPEKIGEMKDYSTVVIDANFYTEKEIDKLQSGGTKVYSYLNLGSIEDFRPYYEEFEPYTLDPYENWPEEHWIDVSAPEWQDYLVFTLAENLLEKGIDGFFIDNVDVYYKYRTDEIFNGVANILKCIKSNYNNVPIIINGGYEFVNTAIERDVPLLDMFNGINHESVYSRINFEDDTLETNTLESRNFYLDYFKKVHPYGIDIYIIEYTHSKDLMSQYIPYYDSHGYHYYTADSIQLH